MKLLELNEINEGKDILLNKGVVAFPTETVYGLGVISTSEEAYKKLVKVKERPENKPFTLMCSSINQISSLVEINKKAERIIKKYMPGPLTLVLKTKKKPEFYVDFGTGYVGFRIPNVKFLLDLIDKVGEPLLVPSANKSGEKPAKSSKEVLEIFGNDLDAVYKGDECNGQPSTVAKIDGNNIIILREGPISLKDLEEA